MYRYFRSGSANAPEISKSASTSSDIKPLNPTQTKAWLEKHSWLNIKTENGEKRLFCSVCIDGSNIMPSIKSRNSFITGNISAKHDTLAKHEDSVNHVQAIQVLKARDQPEAAPAAKLVKSLNENAIAKLRILFRNAQAVASRGRPLVDYVWMSELDAKKGLPVGETYVNRKYGAIFQGAIAEVERMKLTDMLREAKFVSILVDGSTDSSVTEQELFYVRFAMEGKINTQYLGIMQVERGTSANIYAALKQCVLEYSGFSWENFMSMIVAIGSDGAATMVGKSKGLYGLLLRDVPSALSVHCMAHRLELSLKDCLKSGLSEKITSGFLVTLFYFYKNSPLNRSMLKVSYESLQMQARIPTRVGGTRWVSHLFRALLAWQVGYPGILQQLQSLQQEDQRKSTSSAKARNLLKYMTDSKVVQFCHFLMDVTFHLKLLSLRTQTSDATVADVMSQLQSTIQVLEKFKTT